MPELLDVDKARAELEEKDLLTIERETAKTWGGRAAASYANALEDEDHAEQMRSFWEAETYRAEAVEHAAMTEDADFVRELTAAVESYRSRAREHLLAAGHAFVEGNRTPRAQRPSQRPPAAPPSGPSRAERLAKRSPASSSSSGQPSPPQLAPSNAPAPAATTVQPSVPNRSVQKTPGLGRRPTSGTPTE
jgi:hypothetical protein